MPDNAAPAAPFRRAEIGTGGGKAGAGPSPNCIHNLAVIGCRRAEKRKAPRSCVD